MHPAVKGHPMATGTVKWFNEQKGYGFIQPDDGGKDVFMHISAVERSGMRGLAEGQKVSYALQGDRRTAKESAANLKRPDLTWIKARAKRGHIIVRDRARLEEAAGGSYGV